MTVIFDNPEHQYHKSPAHLCTARYGKVGVGPWQKFILEFQTILDSTNLDLDLDPDPDPDPDLLTGIGLVT